MIFALVFLNIKSDVRCLKIITEVEFASNDRSLFEYLCYKVQHNQYDLDFLSAHPIYDNQIHSPYLNLGE